MANFTHYRILIFSEKPDQLMLFYRDILGLKLLQKLDIPHDYGYQFEVNGNYIIWISKHNQIKGKSKEPFRIIHNFYTDSVTRWYKKITKNKQVKMILKPALAPFATKDNPVYVCTWLDPDGNCWQFMGGE